jgi:hypothetical protein
VWWAERRLLPESIHHPIAPANHERPTRNRR